MSREEFGEIFAKELELKKHFKMKCDAGQLDIHASPTCLGLWIVQEGCKGDENSIGMVCQRGMGPYFQVWPDSSFFEPGSRNRLPFAFGSSTGLQVPQPDGTVVIVPLRRLAELAKKMMTES